MPVVIFVPALIGEATAETQEETEIMTENDTESFGQYIEATVKNVNTANNTADITVTDIENGESKTHTLQEGEQRTYGFSNGDIYVTLEDIHSKDRVVNTVKYPAEYGWQNEEKQVSSFMPLMIIIPMVLVIVMILYGMIRGDE